MKIVGELEALAAVISHSWVNLFPVSDHAQEDGHLIQSGSPRLQHYHKALGNATNH